MVCDEEFSGMVVAAKRGVKRAFVADELELGFARTWVAKAAERRVDAWYRQLLTSVDLLIIPEDGPDSGNRRYVGPIVRRSTSTCAEVRAKHGLPEGPMVLVSLSGSGVGRELAEAARKVVEGESGRILVITGNRGELIRGEMVYDLGVVPDNQGLVACADLVVSTAGKSTIDEAAAAGTPIVTIPVRYHAEQERNAAALGYSWEDLSRLPQLISSKIGRREAPRTVRGEEMASRLILSLL